MTGKGPLLITLAEDVEPGPSGNRLEMTAFGKPAQIWRERREVVRADRISFDQVRKTIYMSAGINRPVKLDWARQQWITAEKSVQFDQDAGRAVFAGPGELEFASDQMKGPAHFIYQDKLFFDFTADPNADEIDLANLKPEQLSFANGIEGAFEDMHFVAQDLMCQFEADPNGEYLPTHVVAEGPGETLRLTNEKQDYQVTGDILEGDAQTNIWRIHGNPARALTLQQEDRIEGATIIADLNKQLFEVAESSRLFASFAGDPFEPASVKPVQLHVFSRRGVTYDHAVGQIVMREPNALIEQVEKNRQVTRLLCPVLTIQLADETKMPLDEPNHVESGTNLNLATLTAHGQEVNILRSEYDLASDELLSLLKMRSKNLRFDNINQTMTAEGPGWIDSYDYQPTEPKSALPKDRSLNSALPGLLGRTGPSRAMIIFERQMRFEKPPGELTFEGDVNVGYLPLYDDPQAQLQLAGAASEMKSLRCDKLTLTFAEDKAKTDPNAPAWGDLKQVAATGSVITEAAFSDGQTHYLAGENLVYDRSTETVRMTGTMEQPIYLDGLRCTLVRWNVKDGSFEVKYVGRDGSKGENKNL
ncbi:MAG: hypothetical protein AMJ79_15460 [Phycisphaerae bacterium SM23_30]|nr:MAG: hypothetical protein AMJ79_15460 [Phycisphaerae bacterium SM23_30]